MSLTCADFEKYDRENPEIYESFKRFTFKLIAAGRKYCGSQIILERIRWESIVTAKKDQFKINNNYAAFYARKFEEDYPIYKGFFRKRRSIADLAHQPREEVHVG